LKEREERKVPKLKDILNKAIEQQKRSKQAMRNKIASLSLDNLEATDTYLTEEQYLQVQEKYDKIKVSMTSF
jgi:ribosomal protein L11